MIPVNKNEAKLEIYTTTANFGILLKNLPQQNMWRQAFTWGYKS